MKTALAVVVLAGLIAVAIAAPAQDLVTNLPGAPANLPFSMYAGNVALADGSSQVDMYYYFVQAVADTDTTPVILWLNGGPGCSSIGGGLMSENGPFWPNKAGGLDVNEFAWNREANVVYLESPVGVGFSYSPSMPPMYYANNANTTQISYEFLVAFFTDLFPELVSRPFYVMGESYGGSYVPRLTALIAFMNNQGASPQINIHGMAVGNPWTWAPLDNQGCLDDWVSHTIVSEQTGLGVAAHCNLSDIGPLADAGFDVVTDAAALSALFELSPEGAAKCNALQNKATEEMGNINIYDIYEATTSCSETMRQGEALYRALAAGPDHHAPAIMGRAMAKRLRRQRELARARAGADPASLDGEKPASPCIDTYVQDYLNRADVKAAIHAPSLPYQWTDCSSIVTYYYPDVLASVLPTYEYLFTQSLRILVFSGDVDAIVPTPGTKLWLAALDLNETRAFRAWNYSSEAQVGGWVTGYEQLTFATVRDAGHMVPGTQPRRAYEMIKRFLAGEHIA